MIIRLIHGIHSIEGESNMSAFLPYIKKAFPDAIVELFEYGFMGFWEARWQNPDVAYDLASISKLNKDNHKEVWLTHSNGAAIAYLAVREYSAEPDMIINFNPALDRHRTAAIPHVEVVHSKQDRAVQLAQWVPFNIWGDQGRVGYRGKLKNTKNNFAEDFPPHMSYKHHCGAFSPDRIEHWANFVKDKIESTLK